MMCLFYTPFRGALCSAACCLGLALTGALADSLSAPKPGATVELKVKPSALQPRKPADIRPLSASATAPSESRAGAANRGEQLVRTALTYRGTPYRYGGSSRSGTDCSGLVQAVCAKWGIYLPRASRAQFSSSLGRRITAGDLQPGDLVFFSGTYKRGTSHVGIYVADGKYIHASTPGRGVIVSELSDAFSRKHYCGALRLDLAKLPPSPDERSKSAMAGASISPARRSVPGITLRNCPLIVPIP